MQLPSIRNWPTPGAIAGLPGLHLNDVPRAIADLDEALKLNPQLADAYGGRGVAWLSQGKLAEAEADFARCRALGGTLTPEAERLLREMKRR